MTEFEDSDVRIFFFFRLHLKKDGQVALWVHTTHFCCLVHHLLFAFGQRQVAIFMCCIFPNISFKNFSLQYLFYSDLFPMDAPSCVGIYADLYLILDMSTLKIFRVDIFNNKAKKMWQIGCIVCVDLCKCFLENWKVKEQMIWKWC